MIEHNFALFCCIPDVKEGNSSFFSKSLSKKPEVINSEKDMEIYNHCVSVGYRCRWILFSLRYKIRYGVKYEKG